MNEATALIETKDIVFTGRTLLGYFICGAVYILLPAVAFVWLKKHGAARMYPVVTGVIVYFLVTRYCSFCAYLFGISLSMAQKSVIAAEMVCIFEELGRWLAMKYPLTDIKDTHSAVCYGVGHAGLECWTRGAEKFKIFRYGQLVERKGAESFVSGKTAQKASMIVEQLKSYADHPLYISLFECLHSVMTFGVQIALTLLIYKEMIDGEPEKRGLFLAIGLHYFVNGAVWLVSFSDDMLLNNIVGIICDAIAILIVFVVINAKECFDEVKYPMFYS